MKYIIFNVIFPTFGMATWYLFDKIAQMRFHYINLENSNKLITDDIVVMMSILLSYLIPLISVLYLITHIIKWIANKLKKPKNKSAQQGDAPETSAIENPTPCSVASLLPPRLGVFNSTGPGDL